MSQNTPKMQTNKHSSYLAQKKVKLIDPKSVNENQEVQSRKSIESIGIKLRYNIGGLAGPSTAITKDNKYNSSADKFLPEKKQPEKKISSTHNTVSKQKKQEEKEVRHPTWEEMFPNKRSVGRDSNDASLGRSLDARPVFQNTGLTSGNKGGNRYNKTSEINVSRYSSNYNSKVNESKDSISSSAHKPKFLKKRSNMKYDPMKAAKEAKIASKSRGRDESSQSINESDNRAGFRKSL